MQNGECQLAHLIPVAVVFPVVLKGGLISIGNTIFTDVHKGIIVPVTYHKSFEIPFIPCFRLVVEYPENRLFFFILCETLKTEAAGEEQEYFFHNRI